MSDGFLPQELNERLRFAKAVLEQIRHEATLEIGQSVPAGRMACQLISVASAATEAAKRLSRPPLDRQLPVNRRVVCAAMRDSEGRIICGARHFDPIMRAQIDRSEGVDHWRSAEQGFIDQRGQFMTRSEAFAVAEREGQILRLCGSDESTRILTSEDLY